MSRQGPSTLSVLAVGSLILGILLACGGAHAKEVTHAYHVGNSLTRNITLDRLHELMEERRIDYQFGSQLSGGCTLAEHWDYRGQPNRKFKHWETNRRSVFKWEDGEPDRDLIPKRFGPYDEALTAHKWDALILQPHELSIDREVSAAANFIRFAHEEGSVERFFIYETWPIRPSEAAVATKPFDYREAWTRDRPTGDNDAHPDSLPHMSRSYFQMLVGALRQTFNHPDTPVYQIPVGEILYTLDALIQAGEIPGLEALYARAPEMLPGYDPERGIATGVNMFYADQIHLSPTPHLGGHVGNYVVGMTIASTLTGEPPTGRTGHIYGLHDDKDAALIRALQRVVWEGVKTHPRALK